MKNILAQRKGNILTENVIFIILNLVFFAILLVFLMSKAGNPALLEEKYAKQIALTIDAAKPGMIIHLNMGDAINAAKSNNVPPSQAVKISGNIVTVKLQQDGNGYSYSFFNNVNVKAIFDTTNGQEYYFVVT